MKRFFMLLSAGILLSSSAFAASFQGAKAEAKDLRVFTESVQRFTETDKAFLVLFSGNSAFYSFAKNKDTSTQFKNFLNDRIKSKKAVRVEVNAVTAQIVSIGDKK